MACFEQDEDAKRFMLELKNRLADFNLEVEPTRVIPREPRRHDLSVLLSPDDIDELAEATGRDGDRPLLALLLPVRNGEADLRGWFEAAADGWTRGRR